MRLRTLFRVSSPMSVLPRNTLEMVTVDRPRSRAMSFMRTAVRFPVRVSIWPRRLVIRPRDRFFFAVLHVPSQYRSNRYVIDNFFSRKDEMEIDTAMALAYSSLVVVNDYFRSRVLVS